MGRRKPNYKHIAELERDMGIDDETLMQQWIKSADDELKRPGPKKKEFFTPPILETKQVVTEPAYAGSAMSYAPDAVWYMNDPGSIRDHR